MKDVEFEGDFKKDIEMNNKKFNWLARVIGYPLFDFLFILTGDYLIQPYLIQPEDYLISVLYWTSGILISMMTTIKMILVDKKKFNKKKGEANYRIHALSKKLALEKIWINYINLEKSKIIENKYTLKENAKDYSSKKEIINRDIYFIDAKNNLQILKEEIIKLKTRNQDGCATIEEKSLNLLDKNEINELVIDNTKKLVLKK